MNLYAYCLGDEATVEAFDATAGMAGQKVRLLQFGGIAAVVSDLDRDQVAVTRENVLTHNHVIARVLARATPLPFRFGTVVSAPRLEQYVESHRASILGSLERVRGCVEMSVKIIWDAGAASREAAVATPGLLTGTPKNRPPGDTVTEGRGAGTAFLAAKRRAQASDAALAERAASLAAWLAGRLGEAVREARVRLRPEEALVVSAAHLVERARLDEYRRLLLAAREERHGELRFLTSGAWPPYSFSDVRS